MGNIKELRDLKGSISNRQLPCTLVLEGSLERCARSWAGYPPLHSVAMPTRRGIELLPSISHSPLYFLFPLKSHLPWNYKWHPFIPWVAAFLPELHFFHWFGGEENVQIGDEKMMESKKPGGMESWAVLLRAQTGLRGFVSSCVLLN